MNKATTTPDAMAPISIESVAKLVGRSVLDVDASTTNRAGRLSHGRLSCQGALAYVHRLARDGKLSGLHPYKNIRVTDAIQRDLSAAPNSSALLREALFFAADVTIRTDVLTYTRPRYCPGKNRQRMVCNVPVAVWAALEVIASCCAVGTADVCCWALLLHASNAERLQRR